MKQIFKSLVLVAAAVATLTSCEKAPEVTPTPEEYTLTVNATLPAPEGTKTYLGEKVGNTYPVLWSANDEIRVSQVPYYTADSETFVAAGNTSSKYSDVVSRSNDNTEASFEFTFGDVNKYDSLGKVSVAANFIDYIAIYGGSNYSMYKRTGKYIDLEVVLPTTQKPAFGQFDPKAALMGDVVLGLEEPATSLDFNFEHLVAYAMLNVKNLNCGSEKVQRVTITSNEHKLSGKSYWYYLEGTNFKTTSGDASNDIIVDMTAQTITNNNFEVYFAASPTQFAVNDTLTFVVATDANTYTKKVAVTEAFALVQGGILDFSVDFNGVSADEKVEIVGTDFVLVTDAATLAVGDEVIFVAKSGDAYYAMNNTLSSKKYPTSTVSVNSNKIIIAENDKTIGVMTLGTSNGNWTLKSGSAYIAYDSSTNFKTVASVSDNKGEWTIALDADNQATILNVSTANASTKRVFLMNSSNIFGPYAASNIGKADYFTPQIFKKVN